MTGYFKVYCLGSRLVWLTTGLLLVLVIGIGCGGSSGPGTPRKAVIQLFGAMERDDKAALAHLLDLAELMRSTDRDYALSSDSARTFTSPEDILNDLTGDGLTKQRWFSMQRIINDAEVQEATATVEVTFVDKDASRGYRTKFGLHKVNDKWRIYSFQTVDAAPSSN